ncbi:S-adenosyl-L-methionine-dependent methyltransferase [Russula brevipes]|nr:S-adenosyl-L-methionine-dependent methyltransferase [Russula brevipes]
MLDSIRALEFYCGIGPVGGNATVVRAFDWDQIACAVYAANHGSGVAHRIDIGTLDADVLEPLNADLWLLSPACHRTRCSTQRRRAPRPPCTVFPASDGDVLPALAERGAAPARLLVENVAGFEASTTRTRTLAILTKLGFFTREFLLTPLQFGILRHIPGRGDDWNDARTSAAAPETTEDNVQSLRDYLDRKGAQTGHAVPERVLMKWGRLFDIVLPSAARTCCFTRGYTQLVERAGSILQENEELDTTATFDKFLLAQESGDGRAVEILRPLGLRYFSPGELLRLFCLEGVGSDSTFRWPEGVSSKTKYRLIGNSVNVLVVSALIEYLYQTYHGIPRDIPLG